MGFTLRVYNEQLVSWCARRIRQNAPEILLVAGGPSVGHSTADAEQFLRDFPMFDHVVAGEGEKALVDLVKGCTTSGPEKRNLPTVMDGNSMLLTPEGIASPYLSGHLDTFLGQGYFPMIQTMRGCPYRCTYCSSGARSNCRLRIFPESLALEELDYIEARARSKKLYIIDENFGMFKERDVNIARKIISMAETLSFPQEINYYSSKIVDDHVRQITRMMKDYCPMVMSLQSMNQETIREIKRTNIATGSFTDNLDWARENGLLTATEIIQSLPLETRDSFIHGIEILMRNGIDQVFVYNLRIIRGAALFNHDIRKRFGIKTRFRLAARDWSVCSGIPVADAEEIVLSTDTMNEEDFFYLRTYNFFLHFSFGSIGYFSELINLLIRLGVPGEKLVNHLATNYGAKKTLSTLVARYRDRAQEELFESLTDFNQWVHNAIQGHSTLPDVKLNHIYTGHITFNDTAREELLDLVAEFIIEHCPDARIQAYAMEYFDKVTRNQIIHSAASAQSRVIEIGFDVDRVLATALSAPAENLDGKFSYILRVEDLHETNFDALCDVADEKQYQEYYSQNLPCFTLTRSKYPRSVDEERSEITL